MENKYTVADLQAMQAWPLSRKIQVTQTRIIEWYIKNNGQVYVSFSGGKDSTVLLDLARRIYPDIPAVFVDTGLEYPEIREFVKSIDGVTWLRPKMNFRKVIETYGYPLVSKEIAAKIYFARKGRKEALMAFEGKYVDGTESKYRQRYKKWRPLCNSNVPISHKCCEVMKKEPNRFQRLQVTHPALYNYCMKPWENGGLGMKEPLEYIGIQTENKEANNDPFSE